MNKNKIKILMRELFLTKKGWLSIFLANFFWSLFWLPFLIIWFITRIENYLIIGTSIYIFFWQPLIPMWLITPFTALFIKNKLLK
jgi:hypothetical protein